MPTTIKKCNLCHAELTVSDEAQVVECPKCRSVNGYGYSRSNQNDKYAKGPPSDKNTGVMPNSQYHQQPPFSPAPSQEQALMHALLGGTTQPGSLHFVDTNSLFQQSPKASSEHSPRLAKTNSFFQHPPQVSPSSQASIRMLKTNYSSFQQLSQISSSLQSSLSPVKTKTTFQLPSQTSSPPIPEKITNNFFQQGSPRPSYSNISYRQSFQTSSPPVQEEVNNFSWQPQKTQSPQGSPRSSYTKTPRPLDTSSLPTPEKTMNFFEKPQETSSPQGSPRPTYINSFNQQPSRTVSPLIPEKTNSFSQLPQQTSSLQWSPRPAYGNTSYQQPSSPQESPRLAYSNTSDQQQPLQSSSPPIQEKTNSFSQLPQQTSSPQGLHRSSFSNTSYQKPLPSSPLESPNQPQTTPPQGSSPRPSRFSSFLRPQAAQTPPPHQGSPPLAHSDNNNQKPSSQISFTPFMQDNNGYNQQPLQTSPQMSSPKVQPLLQGPQLPVNNNGQNYQKTLQDSRPLSSSITSAPPPGEQHIQYGKNQGTGGKIATSNSHSADRQNYGNRTASRGNSTGATTNCTNAIEADTDDDDNYTKRRLKEFREHLQI